MNNILTLPKQKHTYIKFCPQHPPHIYTVKHLQEIFNKPSRSSIYAMAEKEGFPTINWNLEDANKRKPFYFRVADINQMVYGQNIPCYCEPALNGGAV